MKKHLKGKKSIEGNSKDPSKDDRSKIDQEIIALNEEVDKDPQLKQAINLLKGWSVMSKSFISKK